ncbi:MAG TPA: hypothetical protein P5316_05405 [Phycisphaerae bacterium]|nr:hypothetical protein [Phycisphaerae bacterium]
MHLLRTVSGILGIGLLLPAAAHAWTPEYSIHPGITWPGGKPSMGMDASGRIHLVYSPTVPPATAGHIYYRFLNGTTWTTPQDLPGPDRKEPESDMCVSPDGHVYVVGIARVDNTTATPYTVYFWEFDGTTWAGPTMLSSGQGNDGNNCTSPCIARDRNGDLHVVWSQDGLTGGEADIMYRKRQAGVWQPIQNITRNNAGTSYGSCDPDIAVDADGNTVHVVWHDDFLNNGFQAYYTKNTNLGDPAAWLPSIEWYQLSTGNYGKAPKIFLDHNDLPNVFWQDRFGGSENRQGYSRWTGSTWTAPANWGIDFVQDAIFDASNTMHAVYAQASGSTEIYYRQYQYSGATYSEMISTGPNTLKAYTAGIVMDLAGKLHVVWCERKSVDGNEQRYVFYSTTAVLGSPDPVSSFTAQSLDGAVALSWTNPGSMSYRGTTVWSNPDGYPASPEDGVLVCDRPAAIGSSDSFAHTGLTNGQRMYYAAFTYNANREYSVGVNLAAMALSPVDFDRDGDIDQEDFGLFQTCLSGAFVPPTEPACQTMNLDGDLDVDADDLSLFLGCMAGTGLPPAVNCTNQ